MANRRVYQIARDRGLSPAELLERLERDGIHDKKPLSTIDEDLVDAALADTAPEGEAPVPAQPRARAERPRAEAAPPRDDDGAGPQLGALELRRRMRQFRRRRAEQLRELGGLAVELRRVGSTRYDELARERLDEAAETER